MSADSGYQVYWDTETTGLKDARVVQLAGIVCQDDEIVCEYNVLCNPGRAIEPGATKTHGIRDEQLVDCISSEEAIEEFARRIPNGAVLIGHNTVFDHGVLANHGYVFNNPRLCTMRLARRLWPDAPSHKLGNLFNMMGLTLPEGMAAHDALADCYMAEALMYNIKKESGRSWMGLVDWLLNPIQLPFMPFGAHHGKPFRQLPLPYLKFLVNAKDMDVDVKYSALLTGRL